jgi:DNA uptake protein ComE-like DNA-binding protein
MRATPAHPTWGWTRPAQKVLISLILAAAAWLTAKTWTGEPLCRPVPRLAVDPNTAPPHVLLALPRLGPARVGAIVEARKHRPFRSVDDLDRNVRGIGPITSQGIAPYLRFPAPEPAQTR